MCLPRHLPLCLVIFAAPAAAAPLKWNEDLRRCLVRAEQAGVTVQFSVDGKAIGFFAAPKGDDTGSDGNSVARLVLDGAALLPTDTSDGEISYADGGAAEARLLAARSVRAETAAGKPIVTFETAGLKAAFTFLHRCDATWERWRNGPKSAPPPRRLDPVR